MPSPGLSHEAALAEKVRSCVHLQHLLERYVPLLLLLLVAGVPTLYLLTTAGGVTGRVLVGGLLAWLAAGLVIGVVNKIFITPMRFVRFRLAEKRLRRCVEQCGDPLRSLLSWPERTPGAFAVTVSGSLVVADRSTGFERVVVEACNILAVRVEREAQLITNTTESGRSTFTVGGAGWAVGGISGGRSKSVTRSVENVYLELTYLLEEGGLPRTLVVPFGGDRNRAYEACAMLQRLTPAVVAAPGITISLAR